MMDTIRDRTLEVGYFLNEGLFTEVEGVTIKGSDSVKTADGIIQSGDMVSLDTTKDYTVKKENTNKYMGYVIADPKGEPPVASGDELRRASVGHVIAGSRYHLNLKDDNKACIPGKYIINTATGFDVSDTKVDGVVLVAVESANANSGKFIDVVCVNTDYKEFAPKT